MGKAKKKENNGKKSWVLRFLDKVEIVGNKLPPPALVFFWLSLFVIVLSGIGAAMGWSATGPMLNRKTGLLEEGTITVVNMFSLSGIDYILRNMVKNFTSYAPMGNVAVIMLAMGVAEQSGWLNGLITKAVKITPVKLITPLVVFLGIESNIAENAGYMVFIPLAAMIFKACGKNPIAGIAAGFAGVSGGFSANLLFAGTDITLSSFTQTAAQMIDPNYQVTPLSNWFFMIASTVLVTILGTIITEKVLIPRLGKYEEGRGDGTLVEPKAELSDKESKALRIANIAFLGFILLVIIGAIPHNSFLRNPETGSLLDHSLLIDGLIPLFAIAFMIPGVFYGYATGLFKNQRDLGNAFAGSFRIIAAYLATAFFASQFTTYFKHTNIGPMISMKGSELLSRMNVHWIVLIVVFTLFSSLMNLMVTSASAKWAILAPIFVPMFMQLGIAPALTQASYRIADSAINIISPVLSSLPLILADMKRYEKDSGFGTLVSCMLPYSMTFLIAWIILLIGWVLLGLPLGPGTASFM